MTSIPIYHLFKTNNCKFWVKGGGMQKTCQILRCLDVSFKHLRAAIEIEGDVFIIEHNGPDFIFNSDEEANKFLSILGAGSIRTVPWYDMARSIVRL